MAAEILKIPFGFVMDVAGGASSFFRCPTGFVFEDLEIKNLASSSILVSVSRSADQRTVPAFNPADLSTGALPVIYDFVTPMFWWTNGEPIKWQGIGLAEFRSVQFDNTAGFGNHQLVICGTYTKDPRCYE